MACPLAPAPDVAIRTLNDPIKRPRSENDWPRLPALATFSRVLKNPSGAL